jgi:putative ATPase
MKDLGYGAGYRYDHDEPAGVAPQTYLPDGVANGPFYVPGRFGHEQTIRKRLDWWARQRAAIRGSETGKEGGGGAGSNEGSEG